MFFSDGGLLGVGGEVRFASSGKLRMLSTRNTGFAKVQDGLDRHLRAQPAAARQSGEPPLSACVRADNDII